MKSRPAREGRDFRVVRDRTAATGGPSGCSGDGRCDVCGFVPSGCSGDGRCDVYGFACVLHETLASRPPCRRHDDMAMLRADGLRRLRGLRGLPRLSLCAQPRRHSA